MSNTTRRSLLVGSLLLPAVSKVTRSKDHPRDVEANKLLSHLQRRREYLVAEIQKLDTRWVTANGLLPSWCQLGPKYRDEHGGLLGPTVGWPETSVHPIQINQMQWLIRPSPRDLRELLGEEAKSLGKDVASLNYRVRIEADYDNNERSISPWDCQRHAIGCRWILNLKKLKRLYLRCSPVSSSCRIEGSGHRKSRTSHQTIALRKGIHSNSEKASILPGERRKARGRACSPPNTDCQLAFLRAGGCLDAWANCVSSSPDRVATISVSITAGSLSSDGTAIAALPFSNSMALEPERIANR